MWDKLNEVNNRKESRRGCAQVHSKTRAVELKGRLCSSRSACSMAPKNFYSRTFFKKNGRITCLLFLEGSAEPFTFRNLLIFSLLYSAARYWMTRERIEEGKYFFFVPK